MHIRHALDEPLLRWRTLNVDPDVVHKEAVRKLAEATVNKARKAQARKAAKESFKSALEVTKTDAASDSETDPQPAKRRRTKPPKASAGIANVVGPSSVSREGSATTQPVLPMLQHPCNSNKPSSFNAPVDTPDTPSVDRLPVAPSSPVTYSDFWAKFRR